jgi:hypothetical protein
MLTPSKGIANIYSFYFLHLIHPPWQPRLLDVMLSQILLFLKLLMLSFILNLDEKSGTVKLTFKI